MTMAKSHKQRMDIAGRSFFIPVVLFFDKSGDHFSCQYALLPPLSAAKKKGHCRRNARHDCYPLITGNRK